MFKVVFYHTFKGDKNLEFAYNILNGILISRSGEEIVKKFKIQDKMLFKNDKLCISSKNIKEKLLSEFHDHNLALHQGIERTYEQIRRMYYWNNLKEDVKNYINSCNKCQ